MTVFAGTVFSVPRTQFFEFWLEADNGKDLDGLAESLLAQEGIEITEVLQPSDLRSLISRFGARIRRLFEQSSRKREVFLDRNSDWLDDEAFEFCVERMEEQPDGSRTGRPEKSFTESGAKSKRKTVVPLLELDPERLMLAARLSLHGSGDRLKSRTIKEISKRPSSSLSIASSSKRVFCSDARASTPEQTLSLFIDCKWTKQSYLKLRKHSQELDHRIFPSYYKLQEAKRACWVGQENFLVTETRAEKRAPRSRQDLVHHYSSRCCRTALFQRKSEKCSCLFRIYLLISSSNLCSMVLSWFRRVHLSLPLTKYSKENMESVFPLILLIRPTVRFRF